MSWNAILGHDVRIRAFAHAVRNNRLAHAYLFTGPEGIGKRLVARQLAKTLLCEQRGDDFDSCDHCSSCLLVDADTHPDLFLVSKPEEKNEFPIEAMQELGKSLSFKPARSRGKVAILLDADYFNEESANCFLKTLEEPPPGSRFILLGSSPDRQLPTILSRCHLVRFPPLPEDLVRELAAGQGVAEPMLGRVVRLAGGSPGVALTLADPALWDIRRTLLQGLLDPKPDPVTLAKTWTHFVEDAGKEGAVQRPRARQVVRLLTDFLSDGLALSVGGTPRLQDAEDRVLLGKLVDRASTEKIEQMLERMLEAERQIARYLQLALVLEALLESLTQLLERPA